MAEEFSMVEWASTANIYEVNVRQYTTEGTFAAFQKELSRLKDMSIEVLWFMPITPISIEKRQETLGSYYACSDYISTNREFGTLDEFKTLVNSAHAAGFKVMIDWVANHTGWDHQWTKLHPEYYKKNETGNFYEAHGWVDVIDLDYSNVSLRNEMIEAMKFWVRECDIDGFRCDMAHLVPLDFWREARTQLDKIKSLFWLGECEVAEYHKVFDATYGWKFLHATEALYKGSIQLKEFGTILNRNDEEFPENSLRLYFTSNHDENSHSGGEYERLGNAAKTFAVLCATWNNSLPLIYSGQEMPNKKRLKFFDKDVIEWTGQFLLHNFYKTLLEFRKANAAMRSGDPSVKISRINTTGDEHVFAFVREWKEDVVLLIFNLSNQPRLKFQLVNFECDGKYISIFSGLETFINTQEVFELQEWEYLVYALSRHQ